MGEGVLGAVRHLETQYLWIQQAVQKGRFFLSKVDGETNPADLGTKHLDQDRYWTLMTMLGFERREGASKLALKSAA